MQYLLIERGIGNRARCAIRGRRSAHPGCGSSGRYWFWTLADQIQCVFFDVACRDPICLRLDLLIAHSYDRRSLMDMISLSCDRAVFDLDLDHEHLSGIGFGEFSQGLRDGLWGRSRQEDQ